MASRTYLAMGGDRGAGIQKVAPKFWRQHAQDAALDDARQRRIQHKPARGTMPLDASSHGITSAMLMGIDLGLPCKCMPNSSEQQQCTPWRAYHVPNQQAEFISWLYTSSFT